MISLTSPVETRAHGWPAGLKLALLCAVTVVLFQVQHLTVHAIALGSVGLLYALPGRVFLRSGVGRLRGVWPFVVLLVMWHLLTGDLADGLRVVLRMLTAVALANLVTMTTRLSDMMVVVQTLLTPLRWFGLSTSSIEVAMALVMRFTPELVQKGATLSLAWRARATKRAGWRIIVPFAVTAIDDAEHVAEALKARGGLTF